MATECPICAKHLGKGPLKGALVFRSDHFWVYHAPAGDDGLTPLGYLYVESTRHVPYLYELSSAESSELGWLRTRLARGLKEALGAEFVLAAVAGLGVAHFHEHLFVRRARDPENVPWHQSAELLVRASDDQVATLVDALQKCLH